MLWWSLSLLKLEGCDFATNEFHKSPLDHPLSMYAKSSEKLTFLTPGTRIRVCIRELEMLVFRKNLCTHLMDCRFTSQFF